MRVIDYIVKKDFDKQLNIKILFICFHPLKVNILPNLRELLSDRRVSDILYPHWIYIRKAHWDYKLYVD